MCQGLQKDKFIKFLKTISIKCVQVAHTSWLYTEALNLFVLYVPLIKKCVFFTLVHLHRVVLLQNCAVF